MKSIYQYIFIIILLIIAIYLRFYRIDENFIFSGEVGHNLLAIKDSFFHKAIPLVGPPTSHPWLYFGPLFYWLYGPILILSNFNPLSHAYFGALISVMIVAANFITVHKIFDYRSAFLSSFLISISPLFLEFSRAGRFFSIVSLLVYPLLLVFYLIIKGNKKYILLLGIIYGSMFSFHFTPIMFVPFFLTILFIAKVKIKKSEIVKFFIGFLIPLSPFILYDMSQKFIMTKNILLWVPYRIIGFIGFYPKNNISTRVLNENAASFYTFITRSFITQGHSYLSILVFCIFILSAVYIFKKHIQDKKNSFSIIFILTWFFWGYIAIFIHGSAPIHYYVPILSAPIIIISVFFVKLLDLRVIKTILLLLLLSIVLINFQYYFTSGWFYRNEDYISFRPFYVPYKLQKKMAKSIIADADNKKFSLSRVGMDDQFEGDYAQNYQYLLWYYGNEPMDRQKLVYTICEGEIRCLKSNIDHKNTVKINNIFLFKTRFK